MLLENKTKTKRNKKRILNNPLEVQEITKTHNEIKLEKQCINKVRSSRKKNRTTQKPNRNSRTKE